VLFIGLDRAGSGSGLWPVAAAQVGELGAALVGVLVAGLVARQRAGLAAGRRAGLASVTAWVPPGRASWLAALAGSAGGTGTILFFYSTQHGFLAITAVLTSLYPAITIVLARTLLGERLTAPRLAGLVLAGVCVALIAVGGSG
jgi:drug/metabolite transporter (DMT)-like permease